MRTKDNDPGEVDLICFRDNQLLIIEVKSTFRRKSLKEIWLHRTNTLRKAGLQLSRKVEAIKTAIVSDPSLKKTLGLKPGNKSLSVHGWIVDTSIEHDHEYFSDFLKISFEEVLIALRDDSHLLHDPSGLLNENHINSETIVASEIQESSTLYPNGFSGNYFIEVIEQQTIWTCKN